jgi:hypothetical protein
MTAYSSDMYFSFRHAAYGAPCRFGLVRRRETERAQ